MRKNKTDREQDWTLTIVAVLLTVAVVANGFAMRIADNILHKRLELIQERMDVVEMRCDVAGERTDELWEEVF